MANVMKGLIDPMIGMVIIGIILIVFAPVTLPFVINGAVAVSDSASDAITAQGWNESYSEYTVLNILANDGIIVTVFVSAYLLILVGLGVGLIYSSIKQFKSSGR